MTLATKTRKSAVLYALLPVFLVGLFVFSADVAYAADAADAPGWWDIGGQMHWAFSGLLYSVFLVAGFTVSLGAVMVEFALNPIAFSGLFNLSAVYNLWMMVRDFFNLFFILVLLFIAFATIFQVQAYNYKKLLWHLLLMALLVNFSFPVSRFIIDTANVPMYFFLNSLAPAGSKNPEKQISESLFTFAQLQKILLPGVDAGPAGVFDLGTEGKYDMKLIQSTIFVFIFGVSLAVLGVLLLIRSLTLLVLVIFSPIGFVGTAVPGFGSHAKKWWETLMSNAFFGPTAAIMLLVAVQVMKEFKSSSAKTQLDGIAGSVGGVNLASMAQFFIPIILIWMSITVGKSFGIAGAGTVIGQAQKFAKKFPVWAGKRFGKGVALGAGAGMRNLTTKKDKDGNVTARGWVAKSRLGGIAESQSRKSYSKAAIREEKRGQMGFRKKRRELLAQMSEGDLLKEMHASQNGTNSLIGKIPGNFYGLDADVSQAVIKKGLHKKLNSDDENKAGIEVSDGKGGKRKATNGEVLQMLHKSLESAGDKDSLKSLESERPDVMFEAIARKEREAAARDASEKDIQEAIRKKIAPKAGQWIADGEHKKMSNVNVMNEKFVDHLVASMGVDKAVEKVAEMPSNVTRRAEEVAEHTITKIHADGKPTDWNNTEKWRKLGASVSSDSHKFFSETGADGKLSGKIAGNMEDAAKAYADGMRSARIEKLSPDAAHAFAEVGNVGYFQNAGDSKLTSATRREIFEAGKSREADIQRELQTNPKWSAYSSEPRQQEKKSPLVNQYGRPFGS